jgi:hypothetical protein
MRTFKFFLAVSTLVATTAVQTLKAADAPVAKPDAASMPAATSASASSSFSEVPPANADQPALRDAMRQQLAEPLPAAKKAEPEKQEAKPDTTAVQPTEPQATAAAPATPVKEPKPKKTKAAKKEAKEEQSKPSTKAEAPADQQKVESKKPSTTPAPPLPISALKEQQLQELLRKYKADEITPAEYHAQRAAILAEP